MIIINIVFARILITYEIILIRKLRKYRMMIFEASFFEKIDYEILFAFNCK